MDPLSTLVLERERRQRARRKEWAEKYRDDPCGYARDVLGVVQTADQKAICRAVATSRRVDVKASHGIGKTHVAAVLANWWFDCWDEHIVYITAPSWEQALNLTFKQIKLLRQAKNLPGRILETGQVRDPDKKKSPVHYIKAFNAEKGEGFQGEHSAPILIIMEEAVGVPAFIWGASDGLMTNPDCRILAIANPTDEATAFGASCADPLYHVITISALEHDNVKAELRCEPAPYPNAIRLRWLREMLEKECEVVPAEEEGGDNYRWWTLDALDGCLDRGEPIGEDSPTCVYRPNANFQGRVLGEFPTVPDEQVIPRGWVEKLGVMEPDGDVEIGCDPARFGTDRTAIGCRRGPCLLKIEELRQMDQEVVTRRLRYHAAELGARFNVNPKRVRMRIDVTGGLGTGPADTLKAEGYNVEAVNVSNKAANQKEYPDRRSELWFDMRERVRTRQVDISRLPPDVRATLAREWSTPKWENDAKGRKVVESKKQMKKRLGASPDVADAVNLAYGKRKGSSMSAPVVGGKVDAPSYHMPGSLAPPASRFGG